MTLPDDFQCIVIDLAAVPLPVDDDGVCVLCAVCVGEALDDHPPTCPWRRAVELLAQPEGSPR